jgi:hypothetical protein
MCCFVCLFAWDLVVINNQVKIIRAADVRIAVVEPAISAERCKL